MVDKVGEKLVDWCRAGNTAADAPLCEEITNHWEHVKHKRHIVHDAWAAKFRLNREPRSDRD